MRSLYTAMSISVVLALLPGGCEPTSGTDREHKRQEWARAEGDQYVAGERDRRKMARVKAVFAESYAGRIEPGAGCDVCPEMCRNADLRSPGIAELPRLYRDAQRRHDHAKDDWSYQLARLELIRLGCIVKGGDRQLQRAWLAMLEDNESDADLRFRVATHAIELGVDVEAGLAALRELARGTDALSRAAGTTLDEWSQGIVPSL